MVTRLTAATDCSTIVGSITGGKVVSLGTELSTGKVVSLGTTVEVGTGGNVDVVEVVIVVVGRKIGIAVNSNDGATASNLPLRLLCD